jgi:POT family proton-dependent oligopeptide transporter
MTDAPTPAPARQKFPGTFWTANTIEIFERAAYYAMASFMVIYLKETLGMTPSFATFLNGSLLWGLIYFLPILSGTLADKYGYKRTLSYAFVMIAMGYVIIGNVQKFWPGLAGGSAGAPPDFTIPIVAGICLIGIGGSVVKPCIAGTVQKTAGLRATLAFGIFYMVINIGSISGRTVSYFVRTKLGIPSIFQYPATIFAVIGLLIVLFVYKEPQFVSDGRKDAQQVRKRTLGEALLGIFVVLRNVRFVFLIIVLGLFWFLYIQLYNLMPLFMRYVDPNAPMDLYTMANPIMIVCFQLLITRLVKRWAPVKTIMLGAVVVTAGMLMNVLPPLLYGDITRKVHMGVTLPIAGIFMITSIAAMAVGEMMASPRIYEYIGAIAPKGQEGLYLGYQSLPIALASIVGGPLGGRLFEIYINTPLKEGRTVNTVPMWLIIVGIGIVSIVGLYVYDRLLVKPKTGPEGAGGA